MPAPVLQLEEEIIPARDAAGLAAFLHLLACVLRNTEAGEMDERVHQLEAIAGVAPLWELLFQLMCFSVPQVSSDASICTHAGCLLLLRRGVGLQQASSGISRFPQ